MPRVELKQGRRTSANNVASDHLAHPRSYLIVNVSADTTKGIISYITSRRPFFVRRVTYCPRSLCRIHMYELVSRSISVYIVSLAIFIGHMSG